jgi:hypothetical protein
VQDQRGPQTRNTRCSPQLGRPRLAFRTRAARQSLRDSALCVPASRLVCPFPLIELLAACSIDYSPHAGKSGATYYRTKIMSGKHLLRRGDFRAFRPDPGGTGSGCAAAALEAARPTAAAFDPLRTALEDTVSKSMSDLDFKEAARLLISGWRQSARTVLRCAVRVGMGWASGRSTHGTGCPATGFGFKNRWRSWRTSRH